MTALTAHQSLVAQGQAETLQAKRSIAKPRHAGETPSVRLPGRQSDSTAQSWFGASQASSMECEEVIFHDLKLMEREGSGIDLLFERLLASGRKVPTITEGTDSVHVTVPRRVVQPGVIKLLFEADQRYQLKQRERITFALIAQTEGVSAVELAEELELPDASALRPWLGRLPALGLVEQSGRTNATRYFVPPALLRETGLDALTTLTRVQPHRLRALIVEDLERFPDSGRADIHRRIGPEIHEKAVARALDALLSDGVIAATGERRWRKYRLAGDKGHRP